VIVRIRPAKYAVYAHMQPGSVRVKPGQHVRTGEVLGLLGNSGNSTTPHFHFSIQNGPHPLASSSLPFVIDRFRFKGHASGARRRRRSPSPASPIASAGPIR
jgi:murein DD-endopeptidase MepM/ murein hydrolase activator NlpD